MKKLAASMTMLLVAAWSGGSYAQEASPAPRVRHAIDAHDIMLASGLVTFGAAYWAGGYVGMTSELDSDQLLLIPLAGPWLSLSDRDDCGGPRGHSCGSDATIRGLMIADGIVQAAGALLVLGSFFVPSASPAPAARPRVEAASPLQISVSPARTGNGWGLAAVGRF